MEGEKRLGLELVMSAMADMTWCARRRATRGRGKGRGRLRGVRGLVDMARSTRWLGLRGSLVLVDEWRRWHCPFCSDGGRR